MIHLQVRAWLREEALTVLAHTSCELLLTGWLAEVSRRTSHVMDIAFKIFFLCDHLCLIQQRLMTSHLHNPSLMKCQCTETAATKAATVADQAELYLRDCRYTSVLLIRRMVCPHIRQSIDIIHLCFRKRKCRWILHHIQMIIIWFYQSLSGKRIGITVLCVKASCIVQLILFHFFISRKDLCIIDAVQTLRLIDRSCDKCNIADCNAAV